MPIYDNIIYLYIYTVDLIRSSISSTIIVDVSLYILISTLLAMPRDASMDGRPTFADPKAMQLGQRPLARGSAAAVAAAWCFKS